MCTHKLSTMSKERTVWSTIEFGMEVVALELNLDQRDSFHQPPGSKEQIGSAEIGHGRAEVSHGQAQRFLWSKIELIDPRRRKIGPLNSR